VRNIFVSNAPTREELSKVSGFDVSEDLYKKLCDYVALIEKWQPTHNLIAPSTISEIWSRHIVDSVQILPHISEAAKTHLDFGSGGGFPGLVIASAFSQKEAYRAWQSDLVESVGKKSVFLNTVRRDLGLKAKIHQLRIENYSAQNIESGYDLITARALADLDKLFEYAYRFVMPQTTLIFPKGARWREEVEVANRSWHFDFESIPSLTHANASLLVIKNLYKY